MDDFETHPTGTGAKLAKLQAEVEALRTDAMRYRLQRDEVDNAFVVLKGDGYCPMVFGNGWQLFNRRWLDTQ